MNLIASFLILRPLGQVYILIFLSYFFLIWEDFKMSMQITTAGILPTLKAILNDLNVGKISSASRIRQISFFSQVTLQFNVAFHEEHLNEISFTDDLTAIANYIRLMMKEKFAVSPDEKRAVELEILIMKGMCPKGSFLNCYPEKNIEEFCKELEIPCNMVIVFLMNLNSESKIGFSREDMESFKTMGDIIDKALELKGLRQEPQDLQFANQT